MTYLVRNATKDDIPDLILLGEEVHNESAYSHLKYSYEKSAQQGLAAIESPNDLLQVITFEDKPVGMLMASIEQTYFGPDAIAFDHILAVAKDHRGKCFIAIQTIVDNYHKWARDKGAKRIFLMTSTGVEEEKTAKLYETLGFKQVGTIHES